MSEWQCSYCKRVNEFDHKTCQGCGAGKLWGQLPDLAPVYVTTAGMPVGELWERGGKRYSRIIENRIAAQRSFNNGYFRG